MTHRETRGRGRSGKPLAIRIVRRLLKCQEALSGSARARGPQALEGELQHMNAPCGGIDASRQD